MADSEPSLHVANIEAAPARSSLRKRLLTGIGGRIVRGYVGGQS